MKSIQLLLAFWLGSHLVQVQAHAVITHSSLNEDSVIAGRATQVELHFNSKIELNLSQIVLVSMGDKKQALKSLPGGGTWDCCHYASFFNSGKLCDSIKSICC